MDAAMFTGLVEAIGEVARVRPIEGGGRRVTLVFPDPGQPLALGESIAVDGACLTVVSTGSASAPEVVEFDAELSPETLHRTTLGHLRSGVRVNLERALRVGDRLGGHLVTGHVDGVAEVAEVLLRGDMTEVVVSIPPELAGFVAEKGSITLAGVSLTVNRVSGRSFAVQLIPHTRAATTLGDLASGSQLNVEVDLIARYVRRLLSSSGRDAGVDMGIDIQKPSPGSSGP